MEFLDNRGLAAALYQAQLITGNQLALIGMDACLMSMIEVACQLQSLANVMVSSQEVEPAEGWPYQPILKQLTEKPEMGPEEFGKVIVNEYRNYYLRIRRNGGGINTQSAINLNHASEIVELIKEVAYSIEMTYSQDFKLELAISRARKHSQTFRDPDYIDFQYFMNQLCLEYNGENKQLTECLHELVHCLSPEIKNRIVLDNFHGNGRPNANGISIYYPTQHYSPYYDNQEFAKTGWNLLLKQVMK